MDCGARHLGKLDRVDLTGLALHERAVARDLEMLGVPAANWPAKIEDATGQPVLDVLVIGAGMNGIAAAGGLMFRGVRNIAVVERSRPGQEGPWLTFARMDTLRSPKTLTGPALGVPSLTFRAWYEAKYGLTAWEALYKIHNRTWVEYLSWLQKVLALPVTHGAAVEALEPAGPFVRAVLNEDGVRRNLLARRVVLATGRAGAGGVFWPDFVDRGLVPDLAAHTNDDIDFAALRGKSIAILGGGASAWDNAATALERGAARVDMYVRPLLAAGQQGAWLGFSRLSARLVFPARCRTLGDDGLSERPSSAGAARNRQPHHEAKRLPYPFSHRDRNGLARGWQSCGEDCRPG